MNKISNKTLSRLVAIGIVATLVLSVIFSVAGYHHATFDQIGFMAMTASVAANTGVVLLLASIVLLYALIHLQAGLYWFSFLQMGPGGVAWLARLLEFRKEPLDERQIKLRQMVFERTYIVGAVVMAAFLMSSYTWLLATPDTYAYKGLAAVLAWTSAVVFVALPSIIGVWVGSIRRK